MSDTRSGAWLAFALTALAGYVDAAGFLHLGGTFVAFMSGNTTRLGVGLAGGGVSVELVAGILGLFTAGVAAGHLVRGLARWKEAAVLGLVTTLLACAALLYDAGWPMPSVGAITVAMGAVNATFEKKGGSSVGLTYMTGTVVKVGEQLAIALTGGPAFGWLLPLLRLGSFVAGAHSAASRSRAGRWTRYGRPRLPPPVAPPPGYFVSGVRSITPAIA